MKHSIIPHDFGGKALHSIFNENGQLWFGGREVCEILGIINYRDALSRLDESDKKVSVLPTLDTVNPVTIISEGGLYQLIFSSRKPEAKLFKKWVTHEVLPSIRKYGFYGFNPKVMELESEIKRVKKEFEKEEDYQERKRLKAMVKKFKEQVIQIIDEATSEDANAWNKVKDLVENIMEHLHVIDKLNATLTENGFYLEKEDLKAELNALKKKTFGGAPSLWNQDFVTTDH